MQKKNGYPIIGESDVIYTYKEQVFSGFAPCFQEGMYSLACCKGAKNGKGMRQSVCKTVESGKTVWVLAIAATGITRQNNNISGLDYKPGDAIYLARIGRVLTWYEYSTLNPYSKRKDSYYVLKNGIITWRKIIKGCHERPEDLERDCGVRSCQSKEEAFRNQKQILTAAEYYIFDKGQHLSGIDAYRELDLGRGFRYIENGKRSRASVLTDFLSKNHSFAYCSNGSPFDYSDYIKGGGACR